MKEIRRRLWLTCLAGGLAGGIVLPATLMAAQAAPDGSSGPELVSTLQIDPAATADGAPTVHFTLRNTSSRAMDVLTWDLPVGDATKQLLNVTRDGTTIAYRGRLVKHAAPVESDFVHLAAGGVYTGTVDVVGDYDLSRPGTYALQLAAGQARVGDLAASRRPGGGPPLAPVGMRQGAAEFRSRAGVKASAQVAATRKAAASASASAVATSATVAASGVALTFRSCSSSQQSTLRDAISGAAAYTANASSWLAAHSSGGGAYRTWFGTFSSSRFSRVKNAFSSMGTELSSRNVTLDCSSTDPYMAFVYADDAYHIYICPGYWPAPARGYDSKAGTLVHESSHFTVNGGARDVVYGLQEGMSLAASDPSSAVRNADNIEHFAESL